jgi:hypothetical protein
MLELCLAPLGVELAPVRWHRRVRDIMITAGHALVPGPEGAPTMSLTAIGLVLVVIASSAAAHPKPVHVPAAVPRVHRLPDDICVGGAG